MSYLKYSPYSFKKCLHWRLAFVVYEKYNKSCAQLKFSHLLKKQDYPQYIYFRMRTPYANWNKNVAHCIILSFT